MVAKSIPESDFPERFLNCKNTISVFCGQKSSGYEIPEKSLLMIFAAKSRKSRNIHPSLSPYPLRGVEPSLYLVLGCSKGLGRGLVHPCSGRGVRLHDFGLRGESRLQSFRCKVIRPTLGVKPQPIKKLSFRKSIMMLLLIFFLDFANIAS